ncbi:peptidoglycan-binding domain-containing protein [Aeromicrobium sp. NPDC092404]|uniref:peptidoglycan-binding domain-containing protein n=1 Tax=Aeromicrobium sp. NPDC092404 TaxID=3154976 RepID=UPI0034440F68
MLGGIAAAVLGPGIGDGNRASADTPLPPSTTKVTRETLLDTSTTSAVLGHGPATTTSSRQAGTVTRLPAVGTKVSRGEALYEVDDVPVTVMYGGLPAYRDLREGVEGSDVKQLEANLAALGYTGFDVDEEFTAYTAAAVERWQEDRGLEETGVIALGSVVFAPGAVRVDSLAAEEGSATAPGQEVLSFTGTSRAVTVEIDTEDQRLARKRRTVVVELPDGERVKGVISDVTTVVEPGEAGQEDETKVEVTVDLLGRKAQKAAAPFAMASVDVTFTVDRRKDVLTVPVAALLALQEGGFGLEVVKSGRSTYVPVTTGLFANGKVEVSGTGISRGTVVGMPA